MNEPVIEDTTPPPVPKNAPANQTGVLVTCATLVILAALAAGGYLLWQELQRMASAKPVAPPEVTEALTDLRTQIDRQRTDSATQLQTLQQEITAMKEQQVQLQQTQPDIDATLAPVQEKLDAIAAQLQEAPPIAVAVPVEITTDASGVPIAQPVAETPVAATNALRDYLTLRRKVEAGMPFAAELAVLIPQLPDTQTESIATLQRYAEQGVDEEEAEVSPLELKPWMRSVNERLKGLVNITPKAGTQVTSSAARDEVTRALDNVEASLMGQ